ncbi:MULTISPECIES: enoyl-CoA hydratase/isomerase family protein [Streptomyces]|uniref:Enoyl-CoA hydratase/isomerase family protein n=1 Tax=Streptomyces evansiae TaxID=3075535 RepID=A0ABU2QU10_9ACTN|nr:MULTISPECIES: enoyl-CoA hydratase/isomerase family protein [unclassified Streptomyces]EFK99474.1 2-ketocyclohexanecarboxyl-CoA hydrolase [Streptomyces sp. SPB78]MDT0407923.1 enoyl-CoA hydratase/isomerase family protein [Streptomyces sp. DSM 41979]MDT0422395.1 enoyl-CoA hydratase/isomerase family protein [Streptomyces sp. DSM 41859]MYQ56475.1 enoyl-CoA hydratase/isomerase family protein [Streptomyces sp. SID4926]WEH27134.1 enoyl-CoA hydratase/isomerase family protein [Streptomyces sp. AM 3-1
MTSQPEQAETRPATPVPSPLSLLPLDSDRKTLRTRREGGLLLVELREPEQGNAVTDTMLDELHEVLDAQDSATKVVVLTGAGPDFCLGGDRHELSAHMADDPAGGAVRLSGARARRVCEALSTGPAVTIARVQGRAIGAGFALALACDLRVGAETASFRLPELALGLPVAWGGLLPRLINEAGAARVREFVLTARAVGAEEALRLSILQRVVPETGLDDAVLAWVRPLLRRSPTALRLTKTLFNAHAAPTRLADASLLDPELMALALTEARR